MIHGTAIVTAAEAHLGKPYKWGAPGPEAFDCSGLVIYLLHEFELLAENIDMTANDIQKWVKRNGGAMIDLDEAYQTPGALLFRRNRMSQKIEHVAITDGINNTVEARGKDWGTGRWPRDAGRRWSEAWLIPGTLENERRLNE